MIPTQQIFIGNAAKLAQAPGLTAEANGQRRHTCYTLRVPVTAAYVAYIIDL